MAKQPVRKKSTAEEKDKRKRRSRTKRGRIKKGESPGSIFNLNLTEYRANKKYLMFNLISFSGVFCACSTKKMGQKHYCFPSTPHLSLSKHLEKEDTNCWSFLKWNSFSFWLLVILCFTCFQWRTFLSVVIVLSKMWRISMSWSRTHPTSNTQLWPVSSLAQRTSMILKCGLVRPEDPSPICVSLSQLWPREVCGAYGCCWYMAGTSHGLNLDL